MRQKIQKKDETKTAAAIRYIPLSELDVEIGTVKDVTVAGTKVMTSQLGDASTSYVSISDGVLYTGNFYSTKDSQYNTKVSKTASSVIVGYQLSGTDSESEWNNIDADNPYRKYEIQYDGQISEIQSAIVKDGYLYMSCSYGRKNDSILLVKYVGDAPSYSFGFADFSSTAMPMMETLCLIDGELYTLFESATYFYKEKSATNKSKNPTDVIWKIDCDKLISKNTENTQGDIETTAVSYGDGSVDLTFKQSWFSDNSLNYNHSLAQLSSQFVMLGYKTEDLKTALKTIGMNDIQMENVAEEDKVDYFIANRPITVDGEEYTLLFTGLIGTNTVQWNSNFEPGLGNTHQSFNSAKEYVIGKLKKYVEDNNIDTSKTKILICGHSRGGATANLVGAQLIQDETLAKKENIYTYTFAAPNPTSLSEKDNSVYNRIFNIVNPEDFVTKCLPSQWGYGRYGTTYTLPSRTNTSAYDVYLTGMRSYYSKFTNGEKYEPYSNGEAATYTVVNNLTNAISDIGEFYGKNLEAGLVDVSPYRFFQSVLCPFVSGAASAGDFAYALSLMASIEASSSKVYKSIVNYFIKDEVINSAFTQAHCAETYCAYMMSMDSYLTTAQRTGYKNTVNCPVDIEVVDNTTGEVVAKIVNNQIDEEIAAKDNSLVASVDGDSKSFWIPSDGDYEIKLTGNDNGTMDYTVEEINENASKTGRVNFNEVEITDDKTMTGIIETENFILDEYTLSTEDDKTVSADDIITTENHEEFNVNVNVSVEGAGSISGDGSYTKSDYVTLTASTDENNDFLGWYENEELISSETSYSFVIKADKAVTAKFTSNYVCVCGKTFNSEEELTTHEETCCKVTGEHAYTIIETVYPTCTEQGYTKYTCDCGYSYVDNYVDATGHSYESVVTAPTCTEQGFTTYTCSCGDTYVDSYVDAIGHTSETISGYAATCTENGLTDGEKCSVCGEVLTAQTEISATGHNYESIVTEPTCTEPGITVYTCANCADSYLGDTIDATGHADTDEDKLCDICGEDLAEDNDEDAPTFNDNGIFKDGCAYTISPNGQILTNIPAGTTYGDIIANSNAASMNVIGYDTIETVNPNLYLNYADMSQKEKTEYVLSEFTTEIQTGDIIQLLDKDGNEIASLICELENESYVDYDGNGFVTSDDAIFFLKHIMLPEMYIIKSYIDFDGNGYLTSDDAIYLLKYTMLPDMYSIY